jgi:hypothetical protein
MAGVSICFALADPYATWFSTLGFENNSQLLELACMVYSCCPCDCAADAIVNAGVCLRIA